MAKQRGQIIIQAPWYGWGTDLSANSTFSTSSNTHAIETFDGTYSQSQSMMLNRPGFEGHLCPGVVFAAMQDTGGFVSGLPMNAVVTSGGTAFIYLENATILDFPVTAGSVPNLASTSHTIGTTSNHATHSAFTGVNGDIAFYSFQSGTSTNYAASTDEYVFYSWEDNTDGDIGIWKKSTNVFTDNWVSSAGGLALSNGSTIAYGIPHPLVVGQDNKVYCGNGRWLVQVDPVASTCNYKALDIGPTWKIQGLIPITDYAVGILANRTNTNLSTANGAAKGEVKFLIWDGSSATWNFNYPVKENYASNIFNEGTDIYVLAQGRNGTLKLKKFNGNGFDTVFEDGKIGFTPQGTTGTNPMPGGIDIWLNHLVWTSGNVGNINAWGSPTGLTANYFSPIGNEMPQGFHQIGLPAVGANNGNGMCKNLIGNVLFIGNNSSGTYTIQKSDLTQFDIQASFRSRLYPLPTNSQIDNVQFWFSQFGTGANLQAGLFKDYAAVSLGGAADQLQTTIDTTTNTGTTMYYQATNFVGDNSNWNSVYLALKWGHALNTNTAAIVRKMAINYIYDDTVV